jgi:hypothetical protein
MSVLCHRLLTDGECSNADHQHSWSKIVNPLRISAFGLCAAYCVDGHCEKEKCPFRHWSANEKELMTRTGCVPVSVHARSTLCAVVRMIVGGGGCGRGDGLWWLWCVDDTRVSAVFEIKNNNKLTTNKQHSGCMCMCWL